MASVRIESKALHKDVRFDHLARLTGHTREDAIVRMAYLWEYCAEHETYDLDPETIDIVSKIQDFSKMITSERVQLGRSDGDTIYIAGTRGRIEWLSQKRKAAKKGGKFRVKKAKRNQDGTFQKPDQPPIQPPSSHVAGQADQPSSSAVVVVNPVINPVAVINNSVREVSDKTSVEKAAIHRFVGIYFKSFQRRFGEKSRPELGPKVQGQIKNFLRGRNIDEACDLIQTYFQMEDGWFKTKAFDFTTFTENLQKIRLAFDSGNLSASGVDWSKWEATS